MELASAQILGSGNNLRVQYGSDSGLLVEFVDDAVMQPYESDKAGRAIFKQTPFISIIFPGDKTKRTYRPATEQDKMRFAPQWQAYEKGGIAIANGTPIEQWSYLSKSQALELKYLGFYTVDLLANASDMQLTNLMSGQLLRNQAKTFLETAKDNSATTALVAENERLKNQLESLESTNASFKARLDALEEPKKKQKD